VVNQAEVKMPAYVTIAPGLGAEVIVLSFAVVAVGGWGKWRERL